MWGLGWWLFCWPLTGSAQQATLARCGFADREVLHAGYAQDRDRRNFHFETSYRHLLTTPSLELLSSRNSCEVYHIPVVVHVIFDDSSANVSDAQIASQIAILNQDYRKLPTTAGDGVGVDARIQFHLARLDTLGQPTSGITRTLSNFGDHLASQSAGLKAVSAWDESRYLNIWIVRRIREVINGNLQEVLAYASFPTDPDTEPQGVVIAGKYVGNTGLAQAPFNGGRTLTHEIGHYLGLFHPFEPEGQCSGSEASDCLTEGDKVCDTPAESQPNLGCFSTPGNSCIDQPCDAPDRPGNYMNYTDDSCMDHFTLGQAQRMWYTLDSLRPMLFSAANLLATGLDTVTALAARPAANFTQNRSLVCPGDSVSFKDASRGCVTAWKWEFPGGNPTAAFGPNPQVSYAQAGMYTVRLFIEGDGFEDSVIRFQTVGVLDTVAETYWQQGFESVQFSPTGWLVVDEDGAGSWSRNTLSASDGLASAVIYHFDGPSCGSTESLISPRFSLANLTGASVSFDYAYQRRNNIPLDEDELRVEVSVDCGLSFDTLLSLRGDALATVGGNSGQLPFVPAGSQDWLSQTVDLSPYAGQDAVVIRFVSVGRQGQNIYLDQIRISESVGLGPDWTHSLRLFPNPFQDRLNFSLNLPASSPVRLSLYDMMGRLYYEEEIEVWLPGYREVELAMPFSRLSRGVYLMQVSTDFGSYHLRVQKD